MAVRIRLARRGRKKLAVYDVVVADARAPRDGRFIEKLGIYNPNTNPSTVDINDEKAFKWLMNGALPSDTVRNLLSERGILLRKHLQVGVIKGAITQEDADSKLAKWMADKEEKLAKHKESLAKSQSAKEKTRLEAEAKVKEKRAELLRQKQAELAKEAQGEEAVEEAPQETAETENTAPESEVVEAQETVDVQPSTEPATEAAPESDEKPEASEDAEEKPQE